MIWPWPPDEHSHDPATWVFPQGRYDRERWRRAWQELFDTHDLVHNRRRIVRIAVSAEGDGAFAVVDVDTLWRHRRTDRRFPWRGRACKGYTLVGGEWKLIFHTGLLDYGAGGAGGQGADPIRSRLGAAVLLAGAALVGSCAPPAAPPGQAAALDAPAMAAAVRAEIVHAWSGYRRHAWGHDELAPLSRTGRDWYGSTLLLTPIDALDTLILAGLDDEAAKAREHVAAHLRFDRR
jgi:hypothetical protein